MAKDKDYISLITTKRWQKLRKSKLSRNPVCEECWEKEGRVSAATEVHHVVPVETALTFSGKERLMFDPTNLRALCHACHVAAHVALGRGGKEAARRRSSEKVEAFKRKFLD